MAEASRSYRMGRRTEGVERTRERILRVAIELLGQRDWWDVTLREVGQRAGVTQQTVLNHFATKEGLLMSAVHEIATAMTAQRERVEAGDVDSVVALLVEQYEQYGDANVRLVAGVDAMPGGAELLATARRVHRDWLQRMFAARLPESPPGRDRALDALYAATDVGTWKLLRRDLDNSREETGTVLHTLVRGALTDRPD